MHFIIGILLSNNCHNEHTEYEKLTIAVKHQLNKTN